MKCLTSPSQQLSVRAYNQSRNLLVININIIGDRKGVFSDHNSAGRIQGDQSCKWSPIARDYYLILFFSLNCLHQALDHPRKGTQCVLRDQINRQKKLHEDALSMHSNMDDLLDQVYYFMDTASPFPGGKHRLKPLYHN